MWKYLSSHYEGIRKGACHRRNHNPGSSAAFTTRYLLGLFDGSEYDHISYLEVESPRHLDAAEKAAEKSFVLLKNNGLLPLDKEKLKTIGIIGPNADSRQALIGNYHGTASRYITIQEGIQDYVGRRCKDPYFQRL